MYEPATRRLHARIALLLIPIACQFLSCSARAEWFLDASLGLDADSNVPRAQLDSDIEDDGVLMAGVATGYFFQLTDRTGLTLGAEFGADKFFEFEGLDNFSAGLAAAVRTKLGVGVGAPWIRAALSVAHDDYDHALRDAWHYSASISAGVRIGTRWSVQLGYLHERRRADEVRDIPFLRDNFGIDGNAWDIDADNVTASGVYDVSERWSVLFGYARRMGQVTSTTRINNEIFQASDAIAPDEVYGIDRFAYRVDANTNIFSLGLSRAMGDHVSINLGYDYQDSSAEYGLSYANHIGHITVLFSN